METYNMVFFKYEFTKISTAWFCLAKRQLIKSVIKQSDRKTIFKYIIKDLE